MTVTSILDRQLNKTKGGEINFSILAQLFSGYVISSKDMVTDVNQLEDRYCFKTRRGSLTDNIRLSEIGKQIGYRMYELSLWRDKSAKRESQLLNVLFYVTNNFWKLICGRVADSLERSTDNENECTKSHFLFLIYNLDMIFDNDPLICKYVSPPKELQSLNCAIFYGGMIEAILCAHGFVN